MSKENLGCFSFLLGRPTIALFCVNKLFTHKLSRTGYFPWLKIYRLYRTVLEETSILECFKLI